MNLEELQTARDRERQTDKLQQLRESFYSDAGEFIQQLRSERDRAAERADDPFDAPEVNQLTDEINTAEQTVEAIYEKRVGKIVKAASFAAADLPAEADGMTTEEQELFDTLVGNIKQNRQHVLDVLAGEETTQPASADPADGANPEPPEAVPDQSPARETPQPPTEETPQPPTEETSQPPPADDAVQPPAEETPQPPANEAKQPAPAEKEMSAADLMGGGSSVGSTSQAKQGSGSETTGTVPPQSEESTLGASEESPTPASTGSNTSQQSAQTPDAGQHADLRNDGGTSPTASRQQASEQSGVDRQTVRVTDDIETFVGSDNRDYDLERDDIVTLPEPNASLLIERDAAERL